MPSRTSDPSVSGELGITSRPEDVSRSRTGRGLRTGQVDVAPLIEPNVTRFLRTEGASLVPDEQTRGIYSGLAYLYARRAVTEDPAKSAALAALVGA